MAEIIENAIYSLLTQDADISSMVGNRVYPSDLPQMYILPAITFFRVSSVQIQTHTEGMPNPRFQVDSWAETNDDTAQLATYVKNLLNGFKGTISVDGTNYNISASLIAGDQGPLRRPLAAEPDNPEPGIYHEIQDYLLWWR